MFIFRLALLWANTLLFPSRIYPQAIHHMHLKFAGVGFVWEQGWTFYFRSLRSARINAFF